MLENASGPISGNNRDRPNVMLRPDRPSTTNEVALSQWANRSIDPKRTSVYKFYQFWINTADADVLRYLKYFTFFTQAEIESLESQHLAKPEDRVVHKTLARSVTELIHGPEAAQEAIRASDILFGGGVDGISEATFAEIAGEVPTWPVETGRFGGDGASLLELLVISGLAQSKGQARKDVEGGGIYINNLRESSIQRSIRQQDLLFGKWILLRKGKRNYALIANAC